MPRLESEESQGKTNSISAGFIINFVFMFTYDLVRSVAGQGEPGGLGVDLHCPS